MEKIDNKDAGAEGKFTLLYPESYLKRVKKFFRHHPNLLKQYEKVLQLLELNPFHPSLRLHKLKGPLEDFHSVSINMQYRVLLELIIQDNKIILINIGDHDTVYS